MSWERDDVGIVQRCPQAQPVALVRTSGVVVPGVLVEDDVQVAVADDGSVGDS